jgi:hypothetical protein
MLTCLNYTGTASMKLTDRVRACKRAGLWYGTFFEGPEGRTVSASVARSGWVGHPQMLSLDYLLPALVKMHKITNFNLKSTFINCNENPIYVFQENRLRGLSPNFHSHVSVSD